MLLINLILAMVITTYFISSSNSQLSIVSDLSQKLESINEEENIKNINSGIINYYEKHGIMPNNIDDINGYMSFNTITSNSDRYNNSFEIVKNSDNSPFKYNDSDATFKIAIISKGYNNSLESNINSSNNLVLNDDEKGQFISEYEFNNTKRDKTLNIIKICSIAYETYSINTGSNPSSIYDLMTSSVLDAKNTYDLYGNSLILDHSTNSCYSKGYNMVDNNKSSDDIYLSTGGA